MINFTAFVGVIVAYSCTANAGPRASLHRNIKARIFKLSSAHFDSYSTLRRSDAMYLPRTILVGDSGVDQAGGIDES